ncbi:MAG: hypothetical protein JRI33_00640 [Deltaproteobacteria bacterium]|nr:hypothetical protein [Deltaproteobacteria bacterium]
MALVFPFGEGPTDRVVVEFLQDNLFSIKEFREFVPVGGKNQFRSKIHDTVRSEILPNREIGILVFRDLDAGEYRANIAQAFGDLVGELLSAWNLRPNMKPLPQHPNIFVCTQSRTMRNPGLRFVLHLADNGALNLPMNLLNHTTDGYVLATGLTSAVLERFAGTPHVNTTTQTLFHLITTSLPATVRHANIAFDQDKDYLAAYLCATRFWVTRRTEEQARLVRIVLDRAWRYEQNMVRRIFKTWLAAIEEATR